MGPASLLAKRIDLGDCGRLLDVGGGSGAFTIALCRRNPELTATILDFPGTVETARDYAAAAGLAERIGHLGGNALTTDWPGGQDVVLMSYLWSAVGRDDIANLAGRAFEAPGPGDGCWYTISWPPRRGTARPSPCGICWGASSIILKRCA